ncbi:type IV pilin protein [Hydrogenophaga sp.]|uniref:type IV pilin protein n=1 Tax=Hydrogenophaga sp. TaxID=1904254 RepID=UPI003FA58E91
MRASFAKQEILQMRQQFRPSYAYVQLSVNSSGVRLACYSAEMFSFRTLSFYKLQACQRLGLSGSIITLALVAALTTLAVVVAPIYSDHAMRSNRAHARAALLDAVQWMERTAAALGHYPHVAAIPDGVLFVEGGRYAIAAISSDGMTYTLTAVPTAEQARDRCGAYRINQTGARLQVATAEVPTPLGPLECWAR